MTEELFIIYAGWNIIQIETGIGANLVTIFNEVVGNFSKAVTVPTLDGILKYPRFTI